MVVGSTRCGGMSRLAVGSTRWGGMSRLAMGSIRRHGIAMHRINKMLSDNLA
jgi:hypothetical protein